MSRFSIQYLDYDLEGGFDGCGVTRNRLKTPKSLDEFDINVIDLSSELIWRDNWHDISMPNSMDIFKDLRAMIRCSKKTEILIILPQNGTYQFDWHLNTATGRRCFHKKIDMNRLLGTYFEGWISAVSFLPNESLIYENTTTKIYGAEYPAAFYFREGCCPPENVLTRSEKSEKITTVKCGDVYFTTLAIPSYVALIQFLDSTGFIRLEEKMPEWILDLELFDDADMKQAILENEAKMLQAQKEIEEANAKLAQNNKYKSILYTNGDELVAVIFDMLEQMLECDLSDFKDEKKEDFLIRLDHLTLIGEIKGVTSNVKSEHVSQLDVHYQGYLDETENESEEENVKALLIMNHQRNTCLAARQPVHVNQIKLAERNGSLIIETHTMLKLFERFKKGSIHKNEILDMISSRDGLLTLSNEESENIS